MQDKEQILQATIRRWASTGCDPYPCGYEVWQYVNQVSGVEPEQLPPHQSRRQMLELLRNEGGLMAYAASLMAKLGWAETAHPKRGDVGVVDLPGMGLTCAVFLGSSWMAKGPNKIVTVAADHKAAWSF